MTHRASAIPAVSAGIGLKPQHYDEALSAGGAVDFYEVHAENFMGDGGPPHRWLGEFRARFPISLHGVGLSVGGRERLDAAHLSRLAALVERYQPTLVSEHLAWSHDGGVYFNDLLPPPLTEHGLRRVCDHVDQIQTALGRIVLVENPSSYIAFAGAEYAEPDYLNELARRSGCGLLLDINNAFVSASNLQTDAGAYIDAIAAEHVGEIHMAGHAVDSYGGVEIRVDNHGSAPCDEVLALFKRFVERAGARPTLLEWDTDTPSFETLKAEAARLRLAMAAADAGAENAA